VAKQAAEVGLLTGEQVQLLRRLRTGQSVTFAGADEHVTGAGLAPLPVQPRSPSGSVPRRPRPAGGPGASATAGSPRSAPELDAARAIVEEAAIEAGRDPAALGMEGRAGWSAGTGKLLAQADRWREAGATRQSVSTMSTGLATVDEHLTALEQTATALGLTPGCQANGPPRQRSRDCRLHRIDPAPGLPTSPLR
jgi:alkanesulfonate monooxygenase SsuD/methylene tetrahydromethanopterin reductase-like flavin-dependent oxidoreductase (luciferase family)